MLKVYLFDNLNHKDLCEMSVARTPRYLLLAVAVVLFLLMVLEPAFAGPLDSVEKVLTTLAGALKGSFGKALAILAVGLFAVLLFFGVISLRWGVGLVLGIGLLWGITSTVNSLWGA